MYAPTGGMQPLVANKWKDENSISGIYDTPRDMRAPYETNFGHEGSYDFATLPAGVDLNQCPPVSAMYAHMKCVGIATILIDKSMACVYSLMMESWNTILQWTTTPH